MIQGDVCLHTFRSPDKRRPVVILTRSIAIPELTWITIAPITTTLRNIRSEVWLDETDGLTRDCAVSLDNIQTVKKATLSRPIAHLSIERLKEISEAIRFVFNFSSLDSDDY